MTVYGPRSTLDWQLSGLTGGAHAKIDGSLGLEPDDLTPNRGWLEKRRSGSPRWWFCEMPDVLTGWYPYVAQPGNVTGAAAGTPESEPPRDSTLTRQRTTPLRLNGDAWSAREEIFLGFQPERDARFLADAPRPLSPEVEAIARSKKGLPAGFRGWAFDLRDEEGRRTLVSPIAISETALAEGNGMLCRLPAGLSATGAASAGIYATREAATSGAVDPTTLREQRVVDLRRTSTTEVPIGGPYRNRGRKPSESNRTGLKFDPPKWGRDVKLGRGKRHRVLNEGEYRFYYQGKNERGWGLLSVHDGARVISSEREGKCFIIDPPPGMDRNHRWRAWVNITGTFYQVSLAGRPWTAERGFANHPGPETPVRIFGVKQGDTEEEPRGGGWVLVEGSPPTVEDESIIPDPDQGTPPDPPIGFGMSFPTVRATYRAAVTGVSQSGKETRISPSAKQRIENAANSASGENETLRVRFRDRVNVLVNSEHSERSGPITANFPAGVPADIAFTAVSGVTMADVQDGALIFDTTATGTATNATARPIATYKDYALPEGDQSVFTVLGSMDIQRDVTGDAQLVVQIIADDLVTVLATHTLLTGNTTGLRTLEPYGQVFGPGGTALHAEAAYARLMARGVLDGGVWNQRVSYFDLAIFPFGAALRKGDRIPYAPANYDLLPSDPYPAQSEYFVGAPPLPPGATAVPAEVPESIVDFETGFTDNANIANGTVINSWTYNRTPSTNTSLQVQTASPVHGLRSLYMDDNSTSQTNLSMSRTFGTSANRAVRTLRKNVKRPTAGEDVQSELATAGGVTIAQARLNSSGNLILYRFNNGVKVTPGKTVLSGVPNGATLDHELAVTGGGTTTGGIRLSAGTNGPRTTTQSYSNIDLTGDTPRMVIAGHSAESNATSKATYRLDQVVVTKGGDIIDRENPELASGATPPPPDRPLYPVWPGTGVALVADQYVRPTNITANPYGYRVVTGGTTTATEPTWSTANDIGEQVTQDGIVYQNVGTAYRDLDDPADPVALGRVGPEPVEQWWVFIEPDVPEPANPDDPWGPELDTEFAITVVPGQTYTQAVFSRWAVFDTTPAILSARQFVVTLHGEGKEPLEVGSPFDSLTDGGMTGTRSWTATDDWHTISVPARTDADDPGYTEARIAGAGRLPGVYVFQEHLFAKGSLTTQAARDAERRLRRAASGSFTVVMDFELEAGEFTPSVAHQYLCDVGAIEGALDPSAANRVENVLYSYSLRDPALAQWSTPVSDPALIPGDVRAVRVTGDLVGDGANEPRIGPGQVYAETRRREAALTDENREDLPGGLLCFGHPTRYSIPDLQADPLEGHAFASEISESIERMPPFTIVATTSEAVAFLRQLTPNDAVHYEDPHGGEDGAGEVCKLRFFAALEVDEQPHAVRRYAGSRRALGICETPLAEVLEVEILDPERSG